MALKTLSRQVSSEHSKLECFIAQVQSYIPCCLSRQPIVTGTSVLAIKYKDGIMMAADNLGKPLLHRAFLIYFLI